MHYMRHNGQRRAIRGLDEPQSRIVGSMAALGLDCCCELSLSTIHCIKKKKKTLEQEHIGAVLPQVEMDLTILAPVCYFSGI